ncbi:hypothetical protein H8356DRAFT_1395216 [Neocallimastix lanati (nom. inval.)]|nr:hypothetical protein H8356DRAFT_1395216 [Neocallimastix sp. JGI-2020a]
MNDLIFMLLIFILLFNYKIRKSCGYEPTKYLKELCENKKYCTIIPTYHFFENYCGNVSKYLYIKFHCVKNSKLTKEKISIVSFYNGIKSNSMQEHSVSEFYQYANIHGYDYKLETINYSPGRKIFFMKFYSIIEKLIEGLKYKKYDWIFWVDNDVAILNPNIRLETFLPNETMNNVHLLAAYEYLDDPKYCCGINAGILFIRVHEWSLNLFTRAISYQYFNKEKIIRYHDQTSLNNVLIESNETDHYVIFPQQYFNNRHYKKGEFLFHNFGGGSGKEIRFKEFFNKYKIEEGWDLKTNEETRKEVLDYYALPKEKQKTIKLYP